MPVTSGGEPGQTSNIAWVTFRNLRDHSGTADRYLRVSGGNGTCRGVRDMGTWGHLGLEAQPEAASLICERAGTMLTCFAARELETAKARLFDRKPNQSREDLGPEARPGSGGSTSSVPLSHSLTVLSCWACLVPGWLSGHALVYPSCSRKFSHASQRDQAPQGRPSLLTRSLSAAYETERVSTLKPRSGSANSDSGMPKGCSHAPC